MRRRVESNKFQKKCSNSIPHKKGNFFRFILRDHTLTLHVRRECAVVRIPINEACHQTVE